MLHLIPMLFLAAAPSPDAGSGLARPATLRQALQLKLGRTAGDLDALEDHVRRITERVSGSRQKFRAEDIEAFNARLADQRRELAGYRVRLNALSERVRTQPDGALGSLEGDVGDLREQVFRAKARVLLLGETAGVR